MTETYIDSDTHYARQRKKKQFARHKERKQIMYSDKYRIFPNLCVSKSFSSSIKLDTCNDKLLNITKLHLE